MNIWTQEEEAAALASRFAGVNQAKFAREHDLPGGASMLSQHIKARRPINLESALVYARGFKVALGEISPRLAQQASAAALLPIDAASPPIQGVGSPRNTVNPYSQPKTITWEELMDLEDLPDEFVMAMPDDALAPNTPRGMGLVFDTRMTPTPGDGVLVTAADGRRYVRRYVEGLGDDWEAQAQNSACVSLKASRDGLRVLAVVTMRKSSKV